MCNVLKELLCYNISFIFYHMSYQTYYTNLILNNEVKISNVKHFFRIQNRSGNVQ